MRSSFSRAVIAVALFAPCVIVGCNSADNPKMPDVAPVQIKPDTTVPKTAGEAKEAYGASKKYQDMMPK